MLSLKDQCILKISEYPSKSLSIPEELVSHLYLGIYYSKKLDDIIVCEKCGEDRPCRHDKFDRCMAIVKEGKRCHHNGIYYRDIDRKYLCKLHRYQPTCTSDDIYCRELALDPIGGPCFKHDRKYKCMEKDYDGNYCNQQARNHYRRCKRHERLHYDDMIDSCKIQGCFFRKQQHIYLRCGLCICSDDFGETCQAIDMCYNHAKQIQMQVTNNNDDNNANNISKKRKNKDIYVKMSKLILS